MSPLPLIWQCLLGSELPAKPPKAALLRPTLGKRSSIVIVLQTHLELALWVSKVNHTWVHAPTHQARKGERQNDPADPKLETKNWSQPSAWGKSAGFHRSMLPVRSTFVCPSDPIDSSPKWRSQCLPKIKRRPVNHQKAQPLVRPRSSRTPAINRHPFPRRACEVRRQP